MNKKVAVVYWSGTGNTEKMAELVKEGAKEKGAEVSLYTSSEFNSDMMDRFDTFAFGCPSMGVEVLEESEFEPMFAACETKLSGKKIGLFGSYGWGDGEWMRQWEERCENQGALLEPYVICNLEPGEEDETACKKLGEQLAE